MSIYKTLSSRGVTRRNFIKTAGAVAGGGKETIKTHKRLDSWTIGQARPAKSAFFNAILH